MEYRKFRRMLAPIVRFLWPVTVLNRSKFHEGQGVYICNHYSIMDANPFCAYLFEKNFNVVIKEGVCEGLLGKFLSNVNCIPIQRGEADMVALRKCMQVLRAGEPLIIFPEGTRNLTDEPKKLLPFKDGPATFALKTKSPLIPMTYYKSPKLFRRTYLIIGDPVPLDDLYSLPIKDTREEATGRAVKAMTALREEIDGIVEVKGALKKHIREQKAIMKDRKKAIENKEGNNADQNS